MSMHRLLTTLVTLLAFSLPTLASAAYTIRLTNGRHITTDRYWHEGDQIKFNRYGGVMGVPAKLVVDIKETEGAEAPATDESKEAVEKKIDVQQEVNQRTEETAVTTKEPVTREAGPVATRREQQREEADFQYYREQKIALKNALDEVLQRYREASGRQDTTGKGKAQDEMAGIAQQIFELGDELKAKNNGVLPPWWEKL